MNKPIRRVSLFCLLLVLALLVRVNWVQGVQANALDTNANNQRVAIERYAYPQGSIIVDGKPVTKSINVNGYRYKYKQGFADGPMYAPITGYSSQAYGSTGLENLEDGILSGNDDRLFFRNTLDMLTGKPKQGGNVITTINSKVQQAAWNGLGDKRGAAVALDPSTGKILALVSKPSYDPGTFAGMSSADQKAWTALTSDKDQPMLDRALRQTYPPGSTFKLVTTAAALENDPNLDINAATDSPNPYKAPDTDHPLTNEGNIPCTNASLMQALQYSCNTVYGKLGADMGRAKMLAEVKKFGFDDSNLTTPIGVAKSNFDQTPNGQALLALDSIGQHDTTATPLQMAMVASAVANNGVLMKPYLVAQEEAANLSVVSQTKPQQYSQPLSAANAQKLQQLMENVVQKGTGTTAQIPGVTVGGKTGTAQNGVDNSGNPYAWFVSYAKVGDSSPIAVAVVVEASKTQRSEISGSGLAAPIAKAMMEAAIGK
ncbi:peptidoglycan D,D-transpeptidase FtsI family protein [Phaeacidiphilus oryzae]|uniref:peptidoglycan D,D-transpeptidase FtsI family protein n=1 Tax=Phaeacidiphilus oryzae TaxID=348818 RepID=UPI00055D53D9|nr:penicillin-binding transpeptidase domain-containing protein [Phaeacidiphilus oryzae]